MALSLGHLYVCQYYLKHCQEFVWKIQHKVSAMFVMRHSLSAVFTLFTLVLRRRLKINLRRFFNKMVRRFEGLVFHKLIIING